MAVFLHVAPKWKSTSATTLRGLDSLDSSDTYEVSIPSKDAFNSPE